MEAVRQLHRSLTRAALWIAVMTCSAWAQQNPFDAPREAGPAPAAAAAAPQAVVLKAYPIYDKVAEQNAMYVWAPQDWRVTGLVHYNPAPSLAMMGMFTAQNADGSMGCEVVSGEQLRVWAWNQLGGFPEGQLYLGNTVERTKTPAQFFQTHALPLLRQEHGDYEVVSMQQDRALIEVTARKNAVMNAMLRQVGGNVTYDALHVVGRYAVGGQVIRDEVRLVMSYTTQGTQQMGSTSWGVIWSERLWAPAERYDPVIPFVKSVAHSAKPNMKWWVSVQAHRYRAWGIAADAQKEWENYIAGQNEQMKRRDEIHNDYSYYIRGTDIKTDPHTGEQLELPDTHKHIWIARDGRRLYTNVTGYNPNTDQQLGGDWATAQ